MDRARMTSKVRSWANNPYLTVGTRIAQGIIALGISAAFAFGNSKVEQLDKLDRRVSEIELLAPYTLGDVKKLTTAVEAMTAQVTALQLSNVVIVTKLEAIEKGQ